MAIGFCQIDGVGKFWSCIWYYAFFTRSAERKGAQVGIRTRPLFPGRYLLSSEVHKLWFAGAKSW